MAKTVPATEVPPIPAKRYFAIGEVSELCKVKPHVLRYWEQEFPQLSRIRRRGNRRYYQQKDLLVIRQIQKLLYEQGYTISGARQKLTGAKKPDPAAPTPAEHPSRQLLQQILHELEQIRSDLRTF